MEIEELSSKIEEYNNQYWNEQYSEISDSEYDQLFDELKTKDPTHKLINAVETNIFNGDKINHSSPMLSLNKVFKYADIRNWMKKVARNINEEFTISPKLDGISARYYKDHNILATRGDGYIGENITDKLDILKIVGKDLNKNIINGEIIVEQEVFNKCKLTRSNGEKYSTPRNLAAGIMNSKDISKYIDVIKLKFIDHKYITFNVKYKDFTEEYWDNMLNEIDRVKIRYPLDGIVIEIKDPNYLISLGVTSHHPRGKIAYKFENNYAFSKIKEIVFQSGKRKLTPVAKIEKVTINNVNIEYVTLHNAKVLIDNDIKIGDVVKVVRSGDVIPYIAGFYPGEERTPIVLNECPYCESDLVYKEPELYCSNENCNGTSNKRLYESIRILGIDGVGETSVEKFIEFLGIKTVADFLRLDRDSISELDDFGLKSASNIIHSIHDIKKGVEDYKVLACLNIPSIGKTLSKKILEEYTLEELLTNTEYELEQIEGIGETRAEQIVKEITKHRNLLKELTDLLKIIQTKQNKNNKSSNIIKECKTICFSGSFPNKKDYYKNMAILAGFDVVDTVTKKLNYLVTAGARTSKVNNAMKNGVTILNLEEFLKLINN